MNRYKDLYKGTPNGDSKVGTGAAVEGQQEKKESQATQLVKLAEESFDLFLTPGDEEAFATICGRPRQTWPLRSRQIKRHLSRQFYLRYEKSPSAEAINNALTTLEGKAWHEGGEHPVHIRVGDRNGDICIDLGDKEWRAVVVKPNGWVVVKTHPVKFRRSKGMIALPEPKNGGDVQQLRSFVNLGSDSDFHLLVGCLLAAFRPIGPYPVLCLAGEQGSAKSTTARVVRQLLDPNSSPLRSEPRDVRDLMIAARNSWVIAFDNLSYLPTWLSDCLCRLSTGGGFSTRELYSDWDEVLFDVMRPVILSSIEDLAQRGDLLERAIILRLPSIPKKKRRTEKKLLAEFSEARPFILGALLTAVATGLKTLASVRLELPRMGDFAEWATACEPALGWEPGSFMKAYCANLAEGNELALDASSITKPLRDFLHQQGGDWQGTATCLLDGLGTLVSEKTARSREWPKKPHILSGKLRRLAPNLREIGIVIEFGRDDKGKTRWIKIAEEDGNEAPEAPGKDARGDTSGASGASPGVYKDFGPPPPGQQFFEE